MPPDLLKAHKALDKAVMELYGYTPDMSEPEIVADLMTRYQKLIDAEKSKISLAREEFENASDVSQKAIPKRTRKRKTEA